MERFRRGRAGSNIILALYLLLIVSISAQFVGTTSYLIPIIIGAAIASAVAIVSSMGKVTLQEHIATADAIAAPMMIGIR